MKILNEAKKITWTKPIDLLKNICIVLGFTAIIGGIVYGLDVLTVFVIYH